MTLLKEGDSINFQKASCTLDGCVKIYTSRVDSVATETGKLWADWPIAPVVFVFISCELICFFHSRSNTNMSHDKFEEDNDENDGNEEDADPERRTRKKVKNHIITRVWLYKTKNWCIDVKTIFSIEFKIGSDVGQRL